ncbi:alkaline shock response membrane anchor protein AmaP [Opitutia bacterium ISCC 51]|nr:alkaline shock response membrane anchor protein AmaP [Opitutae bacterium ISCC 51]QXD28205.1 alkaline shock response membrane anchor protein AmaP [Opitutae bacterium ISCC 52]
MESTLDKFGTEPLQLTLMVLIPLAVIFVVLVVLFLKLGEKNLLVFNNQDGKVEISRNAIQEIVQRTCEQFVEVGKARSDIRKIKGQIHIKVRLKLRVKTRLQDISNELQRQITHAIRHDLGIENLGEVNVIVEGFLAEPRPKA